MLAKEIKIRTIKQQREIIKEAINNIASYKGDGDSAYIYVGHVYPENIEYFKSEGFEVTKLESDLLIAFAKGMPVYLFTIRDDVVLTEEEMQQAEAVNIQEQEDRRTITLEELFEQSDPYEYGPDEEYLN